VTLTDLAPLLPDYAVAAMREALPVFGQKIARFDRDDALLTGVETRTSSPVRVRRGKNLESINIAGLFPAGEGCGFAGGIMSAAIDGIRVAEALAEKMADLAATRAYSQGLLPGLTLCAGAVLCRRLTVDHAQMPKPLMAGEQGRHGCFAALKPQWAAQQNQF
jgi:hypothetical protein